MFIKGKDKILPVLLYLHGGMPDYFLTQWYPTGLEDYFILAWLEQRGAGISYSPSIPREMMKMEQLISDTLEVTNYLRYRFSQEKIYLLAHSGGTFIGIQAAARAPELYDAYIGMSQVVNQHESERQAYEYMLKRFRENGNNKMVRKLEVAPVTLAGGTPQAYLALRDPAMHPLGIGTTHDMKSHITGVFLRSLAFREYTLAEKFKLWRAKSRAGVSLIWEKMLAMDLSQAIPILDLPVYFFHGIYDYTCSYPLAKSYFEKLTAPLKGFYTFTQSAHSPIFEEPEKIQKIMRTDVLGKANSLADA
jgi:pimeloyl-ACP methyl ester carboxylesterase